MRWIVRHVTFFTGIHVYVLNILWSYCIFVYSYIHKPSATQRALHSTIDSQTPRDEVMQALIQAGCIDITSKIDIKSCTKRHVMRGGFGHIYRGKLKDGTHIAIKCLEEIEREDFLLEDCKLIKRAAREAYTWSNCNHPNVLPLLGVAEFKGYIAMISPWQQNGRLDLYISKCSRAEIFGLCVQLAEGLAYIHSQGIIHGDIKSANVVVSSEGVPMFTDFGNSLLDSGLLKFTKTGTLAYSAPWTAPEILLELTGYSVEADVYALGMVILEILSGKPPYGGKSNAVAICAIISNGKLPSRVDHPMPAIKAAEDEIWELLGRCWANNPNSRPAASQVLDELRSMLVSQRHTVTGGDNQGGTQGSCNSLLHLPGGLLSASPSCTSEAYPGF